MATATSDLQLSITANSSGFATAIGRAQTSIKGFKEQASRGRETAQFFGRALGDLAPAGSMAQKAVLGLGGALAGGGVVMLALEGASMAVSLLTQRFKEEKEAAEAATKAAAEHAKNLDSLRTKNREKSLEVSGVPKAQIEAMETIPLLDMQIADLEDRIKSFSSDLRKNIEQGMEGGATGKQIDAWAKELERGPVELLDKLDKLKQERAERQRQFNLATLEAEKKDTEKAADEKVKADEAAAKEHERIAKAEFERWQHDGQAALDHRARQYEQDIRNAERAEEEQARIGQAALDRRARQYEEDARNADRAEEEKARIGQAALDHRARKHEQEAEDEARLNEEKIRGAEHFGAVVGESLGGIISGQKSVRDSAKDMMRSMMSMVLAYATKQIMANAVVAGTEAGKSQAGIPVVGPILAVGAMGAMMALMQAQLSKLPSARGGWVIPSGIDPVVQAHGGEHVIPREIAQKYEDGAPGRGGNTYIIQALDTQSFESALRRNDSSLFKVLEDGRRDRRF